MVGLNPRRTLWHGARVLTVASGLAVLGIGTLHAAPGNSPLVKQALKATTAAPSAAGKVHLARRSAAQDRFFVVATHLEANQSYDIIVGGVKVGVLETSRRGRGRLSFSTHPRGRDILLGFDPHGKDIVIRDEDDGDDVLVAHFPDHHPSEIACCLPDDDGETECEHTSMAECRHEGGTPIGVPGGTAASCTPNPCTNVPPDDEIVCCINETHDDESEAECEKLPTEADCASAGGMVIPAASCAHNPCKVTPPSNAAACCIAETGDDGETESECEVISTEACAASGGVPAGTPTCKHHPCGENGGGHHGDDGDGDEDVDEGEDHPGGHHDNRGDHGHGDDD